MNVDATNAQREKLNNCADRLENIRWRIGLYRDEINKYWDSDEVADINNCIDAISARIKKDIECIRNVNSDISDAIDEYLEDEEDDDDISQMEETDIL